MKYFSKIYTPLRDYFMITLGTLLFGFGFNAFILSIEVVPGGLTGICSLIFFAFGIPVSISYLVINIILLTIAYKVLGMKFLVNTIYGVIALSLSFYLFEWLLEGVTIIQGQPFMSIILGGFICGVGMGIIFSGNGSTGGVDIIGMIINKYKDISIGRAILFCDFLIISSSYLIFHDPEKIVYGFVEMAVNNYMLDIIVNANRQSVQFFIFSPKTKEIAERIMEDLGRGCTFLNGEGGYSGEETKVIVLLAKKTEAVTIFRLIKSIDPNAFVSQSNVRGVYGEGFDQIKT